MTDKDLNTYTATFLSLAASAEMEDDTLLFLYKSGLSRPILNKLATIPLENIPTTWDLFRNYVLRQENHYQQTIALRPKPPQNPPKRPASTTPFIKTETTTTTCATLPPIPENLKGKLANNPELRARVIAVGVCLFCRRPRHVAQNCPSKLSLSSTSSISPSPVSESSSSVVENNVSTSSDTVPPKSDVTPTGVNKDNSITIPLSEQKALVEDEQVLSLSTVQEHPSHFCLPVALILNNKRIDTYAMIDSGATGNFVNQEFVKKYNLVTSPLSEELSLNVVDGRPIASGKISKEVVSALFIKNCHLENVSFFVSAIGPFPVILRLPWLEKHNPSIQWKQRNLMFNSEHCQLNCGSAPLNPLPTTQPSFEPLPEQTTQNSPSHSFVNAAAFNILAKTYQVETILLKNPSTETWEDGLDKPASISATSSLSAEIASKDKKEDPSLHPDYPRNLVPHNIWTLKTSSLKPLPIGSRTSEEDIWIIISR
jgi:hypothetical protein